MHCPAVLLLLLPGGAEAFRICAFNAQRLTLSKAAREHVMDTFVRVGSSLNESYAHDLKPLALPDQGHFPEKRGHQETWVWVWRCGAHSFPVTGLSLLLCNMGATRLG